MLDSDVYNYDRINHKKVFTMTDLMRCMYENYIRPQIESQPKNDAEAMQIDLLNNVLDPHLQRTLQEVLAIYATRSFRLGVRTGVSLREDRS